MPGGVDFQPLVLAHFGTGPAVQHDAWTICGWRRRPSRPTCVVDSQCMSGGKAALVVGVSAVRSNGLAAPTAFERLGLVDLPRS